MPSRAARWISAMTVRSKRNDSRRLQGWCRSSVDIDLVDPRVVDLEVVELPGGAVAAELGGVDVVEACAPEQAAKLGSVLLAQLLLDAVRAQSGDFAADVDARLVDRVAERVADVAADDESPGLRHESAEVAHRALDDDVEALHRDPATGRG